jgi:hypothetical protein
MRMTQRKKRIIEWLTCDDVQTVVDNCFEYGHWSIGGLSVAVYGVHSLDVTKSQLRSLYATLAGMVKDGLLACTYRTIEDTNTCFRETSWHMAGRVTRDAEIMTQVEAISKQRQDKALANMFGNR